MMLCCFLYTLKHIKLREKIFFSIEILAKISAASIQNFQSWPDKTYRLSLNTSLSVCDCEVYTSVCLYRFIFPSALAVSVVFAVNQS